MESSKVEGQTVETSPVLVPVGLPSPKSSTLFDIGAVSDPPNNKEVTKYEENRPSRHDRLFSRLICSIRSNIHSNKRTIMLMSIIALWLATSLFFGYGTNYVTKKEGVDCANVYLGCRDSYTNILDWCKGDYQCITSKVYRCPAFCLMDTNISKPSVAAVDSSKTAVMGNNIDGYHFKSWLCPSAIHSLHSSNLFGGCFKVGELVDTSFVGGVESNGVVSLPFGNSDYTDAGFNSFKFTKYIKSKECVDYVIPASILNAVIMVSMSPLFVDPIVFHTLAYAICFWTVILYRGTHEIYWIVASATRCLTCLIFSNFVYTYFNGKLIEKYSGRIIYSSLYVAAISIMLHFDTLFYKYNQVKLDSGEYDKSTLVVWVAVGVLLGIITIKELISAYKRKSVPSYIAPYILASFVVLVVPQIFDLKFRIHHWMVGLTMLTLLRSQDLVSIPLVGMAGGLFIEGIARWGLDPAVDP